MSTTNIKAISIRVSDVMSRALVIAREGDRVSRIVGLLLDKGVGSVLIVDEKNNSPVGIITKGDILRRINEKQSSFQDITAREIMSTPVITIGSESTLEDVSKLMIQKKISKVVVVKEGIVVGIVTSTDILRAQPIQVGYLEELIRARYVPRNLHY